MCDAVPPHHKPVIGLIGGIGAGKSAVAAALACRGAAVIDADRIGHEVLELPEVKAELVRLWGSEVLKPGGAVNRRFVAGVVFPHPEEREKLEMLVCPHIGRRVDRKIAVARADPTVPFVALDAAVLLEAGWGHRCDFVIYVDAPRDVRLARLAARSGWSPEEVTAREASQWPADEKRRRADVVLTNDGSAEQLQADVDALLRKWELIPNVSARPEGR